MAHDDHFHCYDHTGGFSLFSRSDTYLRATKKTSGITFYSLKKDLADLAKRSGGKATVSSIGTTPTKHGGRDIFLLEIGSGNDKPRVLFTGGLHAREWISPTYVYLVGEWLIDNYGKNKVATDIVDNFQLCLIPMINPDGHEYSVTTDRMWRKNSPAGDTAFQPSPTAKVAGKQAGAPESVDINRNFDTDKRAALIAGKRGSFSTDPDADSYIGTKGGSSFEAGIIQTFLKARNFDLVCDHHSFGCFILHPPADDLTPLATIDKVAEPRYSTFTSNMKKLLDAQAAKNPTSRPKTPDTFTIIQASTFYATLQGIAKADSPYPGTMRDHAFYLKRPSGSLRTMSLTIELPPMHHKGSPGFDLPENLIKSVFKIALGNSLALIKFAKDPSPAAAAWAAFSALP